MDYGLAVCCYGRSGDAGLELESALVLSLQELVFSDSDRDRSEAHVVCEESGFDCWVESYAEVCDLVLVAGRGVVEFLERIIGPGPRLLVFPTLGSFIRSLPC